MATALVAPSAAVTLRPSGDTTGVTDAAVINVITQAGGWASLVASSTPFWISQTIQLATGARLTGAGRGATTIKAINSFAPAQVGSNTGAVMVAAKGNTGQSHLTISDLTLDGNQANIAAIPGYADGPECSPLSIWNASQVFIDNIEVINPVGYAIYPKLCSVVRVAGCRILTGAGSALGTNQQDGVHVADSSIVTVEGNLIDTGTGAAGDDGVAIQCLTGVSSDITVSGNVIRSAANGLRLTHVNFASKNIAFTGNSVWTALGDGFLCDTIGTGFPTGISVTGNTFRNMNGPAIAITSGGVNIAIADNSINAIGAGTAPAIQIPFSAEVAVTGNVITNTSVTAGIVIGGSSQGTARYTVSGNVVDVSAGASAAAGIWCIDSPDGAISGNDVRGDSLTGNGIEIQGVGTAPTGISVTGNRVAGFATGIIEVNGGAAPNFNSYVGNNCHGNTAFITSLGANNVNASNVVA